MAGITRDREDIEDGVVQLRFVDEDNNVHDIGASDLAQVLEGLIALTSELTKAGEFGDGAAPRIRIRAPKEGSFVIEAIAWVNANPIGAAGLTVATLGASAAAKSFGADAGKAISQAIGAGIRSLRGHKPIDFEYLDNGDVKVTWSDNVVSELRRESWNKLQEMKRPTRQALSKIMAPLNTDADVLEVRDASVTETTEEILQSPADAVAIRTDYLTAIQETEKPWEDVRFFDTEAVLSAIDFENTAKWRVKTTNDGTRTATIEDAQFLRGLDHGEAIHKNDIFWLRVRETTTKEPGRNIRTEWAVIEVTRTKRGDTDGDATNDTTPSAGEAES
ncbi:hypothetical protein [Microbacterium sp. GXS0129]|uniref:hypothetical protein n=1 Tax=Microbacterium sp. GXS0129 TaxID=3377836 RepID=UPI00383AAC04